MRRRLGGGSGCWRQLRGAGAAAAGAAAAAAGAAAGGSGRSADGARDGRRGDQHRRRLREIDVAPRQFLADAHAIRAHHLQRLLVLGEPRRVPQVEDHDHHGHEQPQDPEQHREARVDPERGDRTRGRRVLHRGDRGVDRRSAPQRPGRCHRQDRDGTEQDGERICRGSSSRRILATAAPLSGWPSTEPEVGFEPTTYHLRGGCSAPELLRRQWRSLSRGSRRGGAGTPAAVRDRARDLHRRGHPSSARAQPS